MWKRGGRSSAVDRAQAVLSARRTSGGDRDSTRASAGKPGVESGFAKPQAFLSDLSDLSISSGSEPSAAPPGPANANNSQGKEGGLPKSFPEGGRSRFLKKVAPPAQDSRRSPVSRSQTQEPLLKPRYVSSSKLGSQTAALQRLAQIESRIRSRREAQQQVKEGVMPSHDLTSDVAASTSQEASAPLSSPGKRFLKNKAAAAYDDMHTVAASGSPQSKDIGDGVRARTAGAAVSLVGSRAESARRACSVSLESDEEDMKKLLGDSLSPDSSLVRRSSSGAAGKTTTQTAPPPTVAHPPLASPPPRSSSHRRSPFRFTGRPQAHFSPSALSPSPSLSPPPGGATDPQLSPSSISDHEDVLSLDELFPIEPGSIVTHGDVYADSSDADFKLNVLTLDDLVPAAAGPPQAPSGDEDGDRNTPNSVSIDGPQQMEEEVGEYLSDFESESRLVAEDSASQVSERLAQGEEAATEVHSEESLAGDSHSGALSDSGSHATWISDRSQMSRSISGSRSSRASRSARKDASSKSRSKEAAVQTQPDLQTHTQPGGLSAWGPVPGQIYMSDRPLAAHTWTSGAVGAFSSCCPPVDVVTEMLKQHLAVTRGFIESSRHLHSSLVQHLEPPGHRYVTLHDTMEQIRKLRGPGVTVDTLQEARN